MKKKVPNYLRLWPKNDGSVFVCFFASSKQRQWCTHGMWTRELCTQRPKCAMSNAKHVRYVFVCQHWYYRRYTIIAEIAPKQKTKQWEDTITLTADDNRQCLTWFWFGVAQHSIWRPGKTNKYSTSNCLWRNPKTSSGKFRCGPETNKKPCQI